MENNQFINLGRNFYEWYAANKVKFTFNAPGKELDSELKRVAELIEYVKEKNG